jgi:molybdenum cofactor synthesis domain-containing protein
MYKNTICRVVTSDSIMKGEKPDSSLELFNNRTATLGFEPYTVYTTNSLVKIRDLVYNLLLKGCNLIIVTGGTGASPWDLSVQAVKALADKELPGVGDLHRIISFNRGVKSAWASRVTGFVSGSSIIFTVPGNPDALEVLFDIIGDKLHHVLREVQGEKVHSHIK